MIPAVRKVTKKIILGGIPVGGGSLISVQSMTNKSTANIEQVVEQILLLEDAGCDIVRVAIPDNLSAKSIKEIKRNIHIPLIADIHFDAQLGVASIEAGADGIRLNPGNLKIANLEKLIDAARANNTVIRIGVNAGSLRSSYLKLYLKISEATVASALDYINFIESKNFFNLKISVKSSDVQETVEAYRLLSEKTDYPLHLGITEAGTKYMGLIKSSIGIGSLLLDGIGDTIRVSLTADPVYEVEAGIAILKALGLRKSGADIISCPTCARAAFDVEKIAGEVEKLLAGVKKNIKIAVMGCIVNGPGEARMADYGITVNAESGYIFKDGKIIKKVPKYFLLEELKNILSIDRIYEDII